MSQSGKQKITITMWPDISKCKGSQAMKFSQSTKHNLTKVFLPKSCRKWGRETCSRSPFLQKALYGVKVKGKSFSFSWLRQTIRANCIKFQTVDQEICVI